MRKRLFPVVFFLFLGTLLATGVSAQDTERDRRIAELKARELAQSTAVVKGRCIDAVTGEPMAGCVVEFDGWPSNSEQMALHGKPDWKDPEPVVTGPDGTFSFRFVPPPPYQHSLNIEVEGRYPRTARWGAFELGQVDDLGDIEMRPGVFVTGRVVNQHGKPVPRVSVGFNDLCLPISVPAGERTDTRRARGAGGASRWAKNASHSAANQMRYGTSAADGTFRSRVMIPPGTWPLRISRSGLTLVSPAEITVPPVGEDMEPVEIVVEEQPSIRGVVLDENGVPVPKVYLKAEQHMSGRMASAYARQDGTFVIYRTKTVDPEKVRIEISDPRDCEMPAKPTEPVAWGTDGVVIELRRALSFELEVVEAGSGAPVEAFAVQCHATRAHSSRQRDVRLGGEHPGGKVVVDKVWRGANVLTVIPQDPQLAISESVSFEASEESPGPSRIEVERMSPLKVTVVGADGEPVAGRTVELILPGSEPLRPGEWVMTRTRRGGWSSDPNHRFPECLFSAETDDVGQCWVYGLRDRDDLLIRVQLGEGREPVLEEGVRIDEQNVTRTIRIE